MHAWKNTIVTRQWPLHLWRCRPSGFTFSSSITGCYYRKANIENASLLHPLLVSVATSAQNNCGRIEWKQEGNRKQANEGFFHLQSFLPRLLPVLHKAYLCERTSMASRYDLHCVHALKCFIASVIRSLNQHCTSRDNANRVKKKKERASSELPRHQSSPIELNLGRGEAWSRRAQWNSSVENGVEVSGLA